MTTVSSTNRNEEMSRMLPGKNLNNALRQLPWMLSELLPRTLNQMAQPGNEKDTIVTKERLKKAKSRKDLFHLRP